MRIGIFGGSFDPPHIGHLILAAEAIEQLSLERLLWVLARDPPHKQGLLKSSVQDRIEMVVLAIQDNPMFELSRIDIDRPGPHYSIQTVKLVADRYPDSECLLILGGDSLHDLPTWHEPAELIKSVSAFGVMRRPHDQLNMDKLEKQLPGIWHKTVFLDATLIDISAQNIRERVMGGNHFRYYLPKAIYDYICTKNLYKKRDEDFEK